MTLDDIDHEVLGAHHAVAAAEAELERAKERRALVYALANEKGKSSGDIARLTRSNPTSVLYAFKQGHGVLRRRRARFLHQAEREASVA